MDMTRIVLLILAMLALGAFLVHMKIKKDSVKESVYARRRPLNSYEQAMYWRLIKALPDRIILAQVAMNRCISAKGPAAAIIACESLDFVICNKAMRILGAIELEDDNHPITEHRQKANQIKEEALEIAGIKLIRCTTSALPSEGYIAMEFRDHSHSETRLAA